MAKKRKTMRAPGPLYVLMMILVVSALMRVASGPVSALAVDGGSDMADPTQGAGGVVCLPETDFDPWVTELLARDDAISKAEEDIARDREQLALAKQLLAEQLSALEAAQETLRRNLHAAGETAAGDVSQLTDVYQRMKPKEAAAVFEKMDPEFAAGFLARMKPDAAAAIMAGLQPETAYTFSAILAGRNAALAAPPTPKAPNLNTP